MIHITCIGFSAHPKNLETLIALNACVYKEKPFQLCDDPYIFFLRSCNTYNVEDGTISREIIITNPDHIATAMLLHMSSVDALLAYLNTLPEVIKRGVTVIL